MKRTSDGSKPIAKRLAHPPQAVYTGCSGAFNLGVRDGYDRLTEHMYEMEVVYAEQRFKTHLRLKPSFAGDMLYLDSLTSDCRRTALMLGAYRSGCARHKFVRQRALWICLRRAKMTRLTASLIIKIL